MFKQMSCSMSRGFNRKPSECLNLQWNACSTYKYSLLSCKSNA